MSPDAPIPFRVAMEAGDHSAVVAALAPEVVLISPIFEKEFQGMDEATDLFAVLLEVLEDFEYTLDVAGDEAAGVPYVLGFRAKIDGVPLEGIDLLRFDDQGRIREITVFFRPFRGIAKFLSSTGPKLARRRRGPAAAVATAAAGPPLSVLMRTAASTGPKMLGLKSAKKQRG